MGAAKAGLEEGDEIVEIEGRPAAGMSADEVHKALRGEVGTVVVLRVARRGLARDIKVERGPFKEDR
jgi:C-terminal processing protease CtpA/Prc